MFVSSIASVTMPFAHSDYCAAHAFMDAFAHYYRGKTGCRVLTINWPIWREVGILTKMKDLKGLGGWKEETFRKAILTKDGLEVFKRALAHPIPQLIVSPCDLEVLLEEENELLMESFDQAVPFSTSKVGRERIIDRTRPELERAFVEPSTPLERTLASIWGDVLGVKRVGVNDDFFELGGHSLLAVRLFSQLENLTGHRLPLATLFQARTIRSLAELMSEGQRRSGSSRRNLHCVVPIRTGGSKPPLFFIHGVGGNVLNLKHVAQYLDPDQPVYGVQSKCLSGMPPDSTIPQMARSYIKEIRQLQPKGPYLLAGHSFGGWVAYEIGCQLEADGQPAALVALFDTRVNERRKFVSDRTSLYGRIKKHTRHVALGPDRADYLRVRAGGLLRAKAKALRKKARLFAFRLRLRLFYRGAESLPGYLDNVRQLNYLAAQRYAPRPCNGSVTLFRCTERSPEDHPDYLMGWEKLAMGGVRVVETPGEHGSMIAEPNVRVLAQKLGACLTDASRRFQSQENLDSSQEMLTSPITS